MGAYYTSPSDLVVPGRPDRGTGPIGALSTHAAGLSTGTGGGAEKRGGVSFAGWREFKWEGQSSWQRDPSGPRRDRAAGVRAFPSPRVGAGVRDRRLVASRG